MTTPEHKRGRGWAYTGAILGGAVSIAANIAHSYVPPTAAPADWHPQAGAVFSSVVWPVFLFIAIEILVRPQWRHGLWFGLLRFGGLLPIVAVAGFVSYRHLSALLVFYGEDPLTAVIGPLAVDGLMVMATGALIVTGRTITATTDTPTTIAGTVAHAEHPPADTHSHHTVEPTTPVVARPASVPAHLLPSARFAATRHHNDTGRPITVDELATAINIPADTARQLLPAITEPPLVGTINGTPVGAR